MPHKQPRKPLTTTDRWPVRGVGEPGVDPRLLRFFHGAFNELSRQSGNPGRRANGDVLVASPVPGQLSLAVNQGMELSN